MSRNVHTPYVALGAFSRVVLVTSGPCCRTDLNASINKIERSKVKTEALTDRACAVSIAMRAARVGATKIDITIYGEFTQIRRRA